MGSNSSLAARFNLIAAPKCHIAPANLRDRSGELPFSSLRRHTSSGSCCLTGCSGPWARKGRAWRRSVRAFRAQSEIWRIKERLIEIVLAETPITKRGAFYRAVSAGLFPSTGEKDYSKCLCYLKAGEQLLMQGVIAESVQFVFCGVIRVTHRAQDGRELKLAKLGPGDSFGKISLLTGAARWMNRTHKRLSLPAKAPSWCCRRQEHSCPFPRPHHPDLKRRAVDDRGRQMEDLSQDGPRRRRASGDHGRLGGTPLQNRAFADPWLDQAGHPRAKPWGLRLRCAPRFGKSRGKIQRWQKNFILNCHTSAPRWSGLCAKRWRERSRTCSRAGPGPCCSALGPALKPLRGWQS